MRLAACLALPAWFVAASGCVGGQVVRVFDGVEVRGRFINDAAYASYAHGAEAEARGNEEEALRHFVDAASEDPESADIWTRVGALRCRLRYAEGDADDAFATAEDLGSDYEPLWRARAECAISRGEPKEALAHAARAVALDPGRDETVLLYARLLDDNGQRGDAERWLYSLAVRSPHSARVWQALAHHARLANDEVLLAEAKGRIARVGPGLEPPRPAGKPSADGWAAVDEALQAGQLDLARERVRRAHLDMRRLAARAILDGKPELALEEARLRLRANPADSDARVALALAEDLSGRPEVAGELMSKLPADAEPVSELGRLLFAELLVRHGGVEAAAAFLGVSEADLAGEDALRARLEKSFSEHP
jgi:tetratricopeptide (TPR) repeat protein